MFKNKFKLNPDKTEFIVFGSMDRYNGLESFPVNILRYNGLESFPVNILSNCLSSTDVVCTLGVLFDSKCGFKKSYKFCDQILFC